MDSSGEAETTVDAYTTQGEEAGRRLVAGDSEHPWGQGPGRVRTGLAPGRQPRLRLPGPRVPHTGEPGFRPKGKVRGQIKGVDYALKGQACEDTAPFGAPRPGSHAYRTRERVPTSRRVQAPGKDSGQEHV